MVAMIPKLESMLKDVLEINDFFLSSHVMICLLQQVSAEHLGCLRTMMGPCQARFAQNFLLAVNVFSLCCIIEACVIDSAFVQYVDSRNGKERQAPVAI
jgi:hypothetical protein